jgi:hypothetical protein
MGSRNGRKRSRVSTTKSYKFWSTNKIIKIKNEF